MQVRCSLVQSGISPLVHSTIRVQLVNAKKIVFSYDLRMDSTDWPSLSHN